MSGFHFAGLHHLPRLGENNFPTLQQPKMSFHLQSPEQ
jgi:hypothetical protein